ncbi:MAG: Tfp pilus assembly protein FimT/FimU [Candidatus Nealsonbacteria bacterium]
MIKRVKAKNKIQSTGFTLVETLTVIGILVVITATAIPAYRNFQKESDLINSVEEIINILKLAQSKTLASEQSSNWGVYFSIISPQEYVLFKGTDYASRDVSFDRDYKIPSLVEIYEVDFAGSGQEVVFDRITGLTANPGQISLRLKNDVLKTRAIIIEPSGQIFHEQVVPTDSNRVKDSRHIHFDYSRQINIHSESLILTFFYNSSSVSETIIINNNIQEDQFFWEGDIDVSGEIQTIKIHTHWFNDPVLGTQFCVHRDQRYNDKALKIELDADSTGDLINYDASGQTTQGTSIYVSEPVWQ